jgi:hypothetical protein
VKTTLAFETAGFSPEAFLTQDSITVSTNGNAWAALELAKNAVAVWDKFLMEQGLLSDTGFSHSPGSHTGRNDH